MTPGLNNSDEQRDFNRSYYTDNMISQSLQRKIYLIADTEVIQNLSTTERSALAYSIQRAGTFEKLSKKHQDLIEKAQSQLTEHHYRFILDVDDCQIQ